MADGGGAIDSASAQILASGAEGSEPSAHAMLGCLRLAENEAMGVEKSVGELIDGSAALLTRIQIAQAILDTLSWRDRVLAFIHLRTRRYSAWLEADDAVNECVGTMERIVDAIHTSWPHGIRAVRGSVVAARTRAAALLAIRSPEGLGVSERVAIV